MQAKQVFEILVHDNADMLLVYLRSLVGSPQLVDDLFQETMVTAWSKLDSYDMSRPFGPWLRGIAKNLVLAHYRKSQREMLMCNSEVCDLLDRQLAFIETNKNETWAEKIKSLELCIEKLPDKLKLAVKLRYLSDLKPAAAAAKMNVSGEALKKRLQRAKQAIFICLKKNNIVIAGEV